MTPACLIIANAATDWRDGQNACRSARRVWRLIERAQQFDVRDAMGAARELGAMFREQGAWPQEATFLPSHLTVIDGYANNRPSLLLLREDENGTMHARDCFAPGPTEWEIYPEVSLFDEMPSDINEPNSRRRRDKLVEVCVGGFDIDGWTLRGLLCLLNKQRQLGSSTYQPHAGALRKLKRAGLAGQFPLHAWTKIRVKVGQEPHVAQSSSASSRGRDCCYHWVKAHMSRRHGRWTKIKECWRGNPALGIKRSSRQVYT